MGKIKLIVVFLILLFSFPQSISAYVKEAGSSASIIHIGEKTAQNVDSVDINLKRNVIREVLAKYNSPLLDETDAFIETCTKYKIDCYLLPSIAGLESTFGKHTLSGSYNPFGWGGGLLIFNSWADGIDAVGAGLSQNYIAKGADTIEKIGPIYAASPTWAVRVNYFHNEFAAVEGEKQLYFSKLAVEL